MKKFTIDGPLSRADYAPIDETSKNAGYERLLRNAFQTEIILRLRHAVLHGLKSPSQTILSALYLLQKKAAAGDTAEIARCAGWIKDVEYGGTLAIDEAPGGWRWDFTVKAGNA